MKRKLLTMSALALVCGVSVACSSNTSANVNTNSANTNISQENTSSQNNINNNNTNAKITSDKAKEIALNHANLSKNQVSYINAHLDYDDGIQVYDVSLYVNDVEYSYEINAAILQSNTAESKTLSLFSIISISSFVACLPS